MSAPRVTLVMRSGFAEARGLTADAPSHPIVLHSRKGIRLTPYEGPPQIYTVRLS